MWSKFEEKVQCVYVQILSLCISSLCDFALLSHFFCKIFSYILQDFLIRIGIWFYAVENLVPSHLVSVVLAWSISPVHANDKGRARAQTLEPELECGNKTVKIQIENQAKTKLSKITTATASESCLLNFRAQFSTQPKN